MEQQDLNKQFTVQHILKKCNRRKHYDGDLWKREGMSRWYVNDEHRLVEKDFMDCYCEGRPWKKEPLWNKATKRQTESKYDFYWCRGSYCAQRNDSLDLKQPFNKWSFVEIAHVLGLEIETMTLAQISGWANRMNEIAISLICRTCNEIVRPLPFKPKTLGHYAVPVFQCINPKCDQKHVKIRFTHCLNPKCKSHHTSAPLDSRDCESCRPHDPNHTGLKCNYCDQPCPSCAGKTTRISVQESW